MDRFSTLPRDTVTKILSFLTTKDAVRTCVLSKELRHSWAFLPVIKIDIMNFLKNHDDHSEGQLREAELKLTEFLDKAFKNLKSEELEIFEYRNGVVNSGVSLKFLDNILLLKPREVYIFLGRRTEALHMPDSFFCCPSIEIMEFTDVLN
ncbi:putative F-box/FBD/LRR-repeat protein At4g00315 [Carex rostrata]